MAIMNPFNSYEDDCRQQHEAYQRELKRHYDRQLGQQNMLGSALGNGNLGAARQADAPKPVPQPEPNKVLLLLGEDA